jgi:hypothetical protein
VRARDRRTAGRVDTGGSCSCRVTPESASIFCWRRLPIWMAPMDSSFSQGERRLVAHPEMDSRCGSARSAEGIPAYFFSLVVAVPQIMAHATTFRFQNRRRTEKQNSIDDAQPHTHTGFPLFRQQPLVVLVADHSRDFPYPVVVMPDGHELGISNVVWFVRMMESMNSDFYRSISFATDRPQECPPPGCAVPYRRCSA